MSPLHKVRFFSVFEISDSTLDNDWLNSDKFTFKQIVKITSVLKITVRSDWFQNLF